MAALSAPTLATLISESRILLNQTDSTNSFWTDAELTQYINDALQQYYQEVVQNGEGQYTKQTDLNITSGQETVSLPSDFFKVRALYKKVDNGYEILHYVNDLTSGYATDGANTGTLYRPDYQFRGQSLVLRPVPQFSETAGLRLEYDAWPEVLVNTSDTTETAFQPVFRELIVSYCVYKAKVKESLVSGVNTSALASEHLAAVYTKFKEAVAERSKYPTFIVPFHPEGE